MTDEERQQSDRRLRERDAEIARLKKENEYLRFALREVLRHVEEMRGLPH